MRIFAWLFVCATVMYAAAPDLRLPRDIRPIGYDLDVTLIPERNDFSGTVSIDLKLTNPSSVIWLNGTNLKIEEALVSVGNRNLNTKLLDGGNEFIGFETSELMPAGPARLTIRYSGILNKTDVEGFFQQSEAGATYIYSQFEPTSARRAFPCFDEPALKVPWRVTLRVKQDHLASANSPVLSETPAENGMKIVRFAQTKPMPSYLVALAVGPFDVVDGGLAGRNRIPLRYIVPRGRSTEVAYVKEVTPRIIAKLEEFFGIPYPYEKLDQAAIPVTVGFGAMENAGLITYAQTILLARKEDDSISRRRYAAEVITHEVAHQWFGNMVTPAWWDDIWLNEAFATWLEAKVLDELEPSWNLLVSAASEKSAVMSADGLLSARKIRQPIENMGDIGQAFDGITYQKGASVIRMFENYLGPEVFRRGVQHYMAKHAWAAATANDFLAALSAASGKDVTSAFSTFLDRGGVPLLTVDLKCDNDVRVALSQERLLPLGSRGSKEASWQIPVCFAYENGKAVAHECALLADPRDEIRLKNATGCPAWITADDNAAGYYRVLYKDGLQDRVRDKAIDRLPLQERVNLIRNAQALVSAGLMPARSGFEWARRFAGSTDREIVSATIAIVNSLSADTPKEQRAKLARFVRDAYGQRAKQLGWIPRNGESEDAMLLRPAVLSLVSTIGEDRELANEARLLAVKWLKNRKAVDASVVNAVLGAAAWRGDQRLFDLLKEAAAASQSRRDRDRLISALGGFRDPAIAREALQWMLEGPLDIRETMNLLFAFRQNDETRFVPWEFLSEHYEAVVKKLPTLLGAGAASELPFTGTAFCDTGGPAKVQAFFGERIKEVSGGQRSLAQTIETIELCSARRATQMPQIAEYLESY